MSIEFAVILLTLLWLSSIVTVVWDWVPRLRPSWWYRLPRFLPEWETAAMIPTTLAIPLMWLMILGPISPTGALRLASQILIGAFVLTGVWPFFSVIFLGRPKFLIPPWRRAQMLQEDATNDGQAHPPRD